LNRLQVRELFIKIVKIFFKYLLGNLFTGFLNLIAIVFDVEDFILEKKVLPVPFIKGLDSYSEGPGKTNS
jgi:hypothetical protein